MNRSYRRAVRGCSGQPELRPPNGLSVSATSYGNQCNSSTKHGSTDQLSAAMQLPHCYSPLLRLQDLSTMVHRPGSDLGPGPQPKDLDARKHLHSHSPVVVSSCGGPLVRLPPSTGNEETEPCEDSMRDQNGFSPVSSDSLERCSPIPNGYLHFESTLFDSGDRENEDDEEEELVPFQQHSSKSARDRTVTDPNITSGSGVGHNSTYKPSVLNLMSKRLSELDPTLSPSALPDMSMGDGWSMDQDSDSDSAMTGDTLDHGLISPVGTNSNPNSPKKKPLPVVQYLEGDLVWAKFNRRPWWPCRVTIDSLEGIHTRMKVPSRRPCRIYYVETLGEMADHAWVPGKVTYPFTGGEQFTDLPVLRRRGKQREKDYKYTIPKRLFESWKVGVLEAEFLLPDLLKNTAVSSYMPSNSEERVSFPLPDEKPSEAPSCSSSMLTAPPSFSLPPTETNIPLLPTWLQPAHPGLPLGGQPRPPPGPTSGEPAKTQALAGLKQSLSQDVLHHVIESLSKQPPAVTSFSTDSSSDGANPPLPSDPVSLERKRPRKPSHKVLECTIEEVSVSPPKKKEFKNQSVQTDVKTEVRDTQVKSVKKEVPVSSVTTPESMVSLQTSSPAWPPSPTVLLTPKEETEKISPGVGGESHTNGERTPKPEVFSPGLNDSFSLPGEGSLVSSTKKNTGEKGGAASMKENVCQVCERTGELLLCEGQCCGAFHLQCIGLSEAPRGKFICCECTKGIHTCFVCKKSGDGVKRCMVPVCGKFYHNECILKHTPTQPQNKGVRCSLHVCLSCHITNPLNSCTSKSRFQFHSALIEPER
ncbi:unnamed protein product [Oncorhynchus mykiss]|uniref:PWWP domain-containing protein n=1 Tax=Oncorhynchus mykiss TaxID=8022 RepID=A0A060Y0Q4_ONCMY|nr:unnamed protein product [Oncorhynchus mykiss]